jgi:hypothetical protein
VSDTVRPPYPRIASDPRITPDRRIVGFLSAWLSSGHVRSWRLGTARAMTTPQRRRRNDAPSGGVRAVGGATVLVAWGTLPSVSTGWLEPGVSTGGTRWGGARAGDLSVATCSPRFPRRAVGWCQWAGCGRVSRSVPPAVGLAVGSCVVADGAPPEPGHRRPTVSLLPGSDPDHRRQGSMSGPGVHPAVVSGPRRP